MSKLNTGTIALLFFAILFGLAGTYALRVALTQNNKPVDRNSGPKKATTVTVPMASRDLSAGSTLVMDDVALFSMTREQIRKRVGSKAFMTLPDQIIGKTLRNDLKSGSVFNTKDFYPEGRGQGIVNRLLPGQRALTIRISPVNALMGFAGPGQKVDVLFHYGQRPPSPRQTQSAYLPPLNSGYTGPNSHGQGAIQTAGQHQPNDDQTVDQQLRSATATLVQDVEILALGKNSTPTASSMGLTNEELVTVTLAVNPRQAELIRVAEGHGMLSLTLRSPDDERTVPLVSPVTLDQIVGLKSRVSKMEIFRGTEKTQLRFQEGRKIERRIFDHHGNSVVHPTPASAVVPRRNPHLSQRENPPVSSQIYSSPLPQQSRAAADLKPLHQTTTPHSAVHPEAASKTRQHQYLKLMDSN